MRRFKIEALLTIHVINFVSSVSASQATNDEPKCKKTSSEPLYDCFINYFPLPPSWTRVTLHHLVPPIAVGQEEPNLVQRLSYDSASSEWDLSSIDPKLPLTFFTHGFNHDRETNVIFLKWYVKTLIGDGLISLVSTYYKTMANYEIIVDSVSKAIITVIDHVEQARGGWESEEARSKYFGQFRFYGHSLGAHMISEAVSKVHQLRPFAKFGKLVGLDPSLPCFSNGNLGISANKTAGSTNQLIIIHTNLGFTGIESPRSRLEIAVNGGTFQPSCQWYDMSCNHVRATDILHYFDDHCQMVAYRCNKYEQFKLGACETCEQAANPDSPNDYGCILVNLNEQHVDQDGLFLGNYDDETRQLADEDDPDIVVAKIKSNSKDKRHQKPKEEQLRARGPFYHFVNTNPAINPSSHCLQHYQTRLLILDGGPLWYQKCPLKSHLLGNSAKIKLQLFYEPLYGQFNRSEINTNQSTFGSQELQAIVTDELHTGLINYEGKPRVFVGALVKNLNLKSWSKCLMDAKEPRKEEFQFVLDVAFMSHIKKSVRHMYSSVLCGQWNPYAYKNNDNELVLNLCKQSELTQVSGKIDELLRQAKFEHQYEPWHLSLLNSLFSLYVEWDPLR